MSLSFEDSLKNNEEKIAASVAPMSLGNNEVAMASMDEPDIATPSIMTLEETGGIAAYAGDDGSWKQHSSTAYSRFVNYSNKPIFSDNNLSIVNDEKDITLSKKQYNITQEENSQYIPFEMPRYYDGYDLTQTIITIHYETSSGYHGATKPVDVVYNDEKIRFAWLVDAGATKDAGRLKFEIQARGTVKDEDGETFSYVWKSRINEGLNVLQSLCNCEEVVEIMEETWMQTLVEDVARAVASELADITVGAQVTAAKDYAEAAAKSAAEAGSKVEEALESYATQTYVGDKIAETVGVLGTDSEGNANDVPDYVASKLGAIIDKDKNDITVKKYVDDAVANVDVSEQLGAFDTDDEGNATFGEDADGNDITTVVGYVDYKVSTVDVSKQLGAFDEDDEGNATFGEDADGNDITTVVGYVDYKVDSIDVSEQLGAFDTDDEGNATFGKDGSGNDITTVVGYVDYKFGKVDVSGQLGDYYTKTEIDNELNSITADVETNAGDIESINTKIEEINQDIANLASSSNISYKATYGDVETEDGILENMFTLWEVHGAEGETTTETVKSRFKIEGGSSGTTSSTKPVIEYVTPTPYVVTTKDKAIIYYNFTDTDASGNPVPEATATWSIGQSMTTMKKVATETIEIGENLYFDVTDYLITGKQLIKVEITDVYGGYTQGVWSVKRVDIRLDDNDIKFDDTRPVVIGNDLELTYVAWGDITEKYVHFILDGELLNSVQVTTSGDSKKYRIPAQEHGAHLLKMYMTATIDKNPISTEPVYRDIIWYDENSTKPVIGTRYQEFTAKQYDTTEIEYTVYDPNTSYPKIEIAVDGEVVSNKTMNKTTDSYSFKTDKIGTHIITITCGEGEDETVKTTKTLKATIEDLGIQISPVVEGWMFDFNPVGKSNKSEQDKNWTDGSVSMSVSDNFDWINGGYQTDENGDQYFCVKAGTTATINYPLFGNDARINGKEFKTIFKTTNVRKRDTSFINCMNNGIGLDMKVENANIHLSDKSMHTPYCENDIIEFDFNIYAYDTEKTFEQNIDLGNMPIILTFEDGAPSTPLEYTVDGDITSSFWQSTPQPITIGSEDCDVHIYRMRVYEKSLSDLDVLKNFIADARSAEEMINRHQRNQIYDTNGNLVSTSASGDFSAEALMKAAPDLRYIFLEVPRFTYDKDDKVDDCNVYFRYPAGTRPEDNWDCTGMRHRGQGTSSNSYGYAGRNLDLCMDRSTSEFTWKDADGKEVKSKTITLTDTSVPTDYLNIKVKYLPLYMATYIE